MTKRRDVFDPTDPAGLPPEQRLYEVASILATGVIRMRERRAVSEPEIRPCRNRVRGTGAAARRAGPGVSKIPPESSENCLELSRGSSPDGQSG